MKIEKLKLDWRGPLTPINNVTKIVLHHPAHSTWNAQEIHDYHKNSNGWNGAGYNYFITKDGQAQEMRGKNVGAHVKNHNSNTLGISFQGNFDLEQMGEKQIEAGAWLISNLVREYGLTINNVIGHRDLAATSCPGTYFPMSKIKQKVLEFINPRTKEKEEPKTEGWKLEGIDYLAKNELMNNREYWEKRINEPMPVWAITILLKRILEK